MKKNRIIYIFLLIAILIGILGYIGINYLKNKEVSTQVEEYTPQEEITDAQMRKTMVNLYFYNNATGELEPETRLVDATELLENPYIKLMQMLIEGPKGEKLNNIMPDGVKVHNAKLEGNCVIVDISQELLNYTEDKDLKEKMINSIVKTLTQLIEVDSVKILVNGQENGVFEGTYPKR